MFDVKEELKKLPDKPGVYLMHDKADSIIYVGKAVSLKNRVRQYFQPGRNVSPKIELMISQIARFEYIVTDSETTALVLECNLIKEYSPKYNTMLKDDKSYPYIKATVRDTYPRLIVTRMRKRDGSRYFGPYTNVTAMRETLDFLNEAFSLKTCGKMLSEGVKDGRPCLYYHIKKCCAPCQGNVGREEYMENFNRAIAVLSGNAADVIKELKAKMEEASERLEFEKAAAFRDSIENIKKVGEKQKASGDESEDRDIIAMADSGDEAVVQVFFVRGGKMIGREHHYLTGVGGENEGDVIASFVKQYYADSPDVPKELILPCAITDAEAIAEWLAEKKGRKVSLSVPKMGEKLKLLELARKNAELVLAQDAEKIRKERERTIGAMRELSECLGLSDLARVESYDISNTNGFESVGSMVVFENGMPRKHDYRKFKIRTVKGPDDYASMREMLERRFEHGLRDAENNSGFATLPDIIFMDGGKGQVNVALSVLDEYGLDIPVCGMVKDDRHRTRGLYYNGEEVPLKASGECFKLVTRIQDETHRFAIEYHRSLRSRKQVRSVLDDINGIGPKRRRALMQRFKSLEAIRAASVEELAQAEGMNMSAAKEVHEFFRRK